MNHKCRHKECPNTYDDVVGGDMAFGRNKRGAECLPCFYADQLLEQDLTPERVAAVPVIVDSFNEHLSRTGWTWRDVEAAYARRQLAHPAY